MAIVAASATAQEELARGKEAYRRAQFKQAVDAFELAAKSAAANSEIQHWLGRAYGRLAETSSFINAPRYAVRCRQAFEKAVELDSANLEAWNDLFSYYLEAPGFMGGGVDKAERATAKIQGLDEAEGHYARAQLAKKRKDLDAAERELKHAAELEPRKVGRHVDLAVLLSERGKLAASDAAFAQAAAIDGNHPGYLFERAKVLISTKRDPVEARRLLDQYLKAKLDFDDPPPAEARKLLAQVSSK
jgi:Flp pilus assembly protein TadD